MSRFEVKKETCPLREKSGRRASLTTKGESGAFGKEQSLKTRPAAHWRATSGGVAERPGFARRQTPTLELQARRPPRQPSPCRLRPRNQGPKRTSGRRGRRPTRRPAGSPRTHDSVRHSRRDPRSKNKWFARSKLPRAPCNRRRRAPSSPQICPSCGSRRGIILNFPFAVKTPRRGRGRRRSSRSGRSPCPIRRCARAHTRASCCRTSSRCRRRRPRTRRAPAPSR